MFANRISAVDLSLSSSKSDLLGADKATARRINVSFRAAGYYTKPVQSTVDLGVQTSAGRRRVGSNLLFRFKKVKKRLVKLKGFIKGNRSLLKVVKTGAWPAASYGHVAQGFSPSQICRPREAFAGACNIPVSTSAPGRPWP